MSKSVEEFVRFFTANEGRLRALAMSLVTSLDASLGHDNGMATNAVLGLNVDISTSGPATLYWDSTSSGVWGS